MPEAVHVKALRKICRKRKNGSSVSLPGGMRGIIKDGTLVFEPDTGRADSKKEISDFDMELSPGENLLPCGYRLVLSNGKSEGDATTILDSTALHFPLRARNRREGDKILSGGMHKSVKKLMCDKKLPREIRDSYPIIYDKDGIVLIPKVATRDKAKKQNGDLSVTLYTK